MANPDAEKVTNQYLYGSTNTPVDLTDPSLIRSPNTTTTITFGRHEYMTEGAGRFAVGPVFTIVTRYFSTDGALIPAGSYTKAQIATFFGLGFFGENLDQADLADAVDDYAERVYVHNNTSFQLIDDNDLPSGKELRFVVEPNGERYIENYSIVPRITNPPENFDFEGGNLITNIGNNALEAIIDPSGIGRQVEFQFDGVAPIVEKYTEDNYFQELSYRSTWTNPNLLTLRSSIDELAGQLFSNGVIKFLESDKPIIYGTNGNDDINGEVTPTGVDLDPLISLILTQRLEPFVPNGIHYVAGNGNDVVSGTNAGDVIEGNRGNDYLDGKGGSDVALFSGVCLEYNISRSNDGIVTITHARGSMSDGIDTLTNIETARFSDGKELDLTAIEIHGCTELGFIQDFVTGTTQDTQVVFDLEREGDTSYDIEIFVDGRVTTGNAVFNDFFYTLPAGNNPQLVIGASVAEAFGDVAFDFEISIEVVSPLKQLVMFSDATAGGVLIGDEVDDQGGWWWGDPHLITFDNVAYDFQAEGEFVLARATTGAAYELQARFKALSSAVSVADAMATRIGTNVVSIEVDGSDGILRIDGVETELDDGAVLNVDTGTVSREGRTISIDHGNGDQTEATIFAGFLNATPRPAATRDAGGFEGLLGNDNGTPADDFRLADGTVLLTPVPIETLYGEFADSWIVAAADRMLPGEPTAYDAPDRIVTIDSLPATLRAEAEAVVDGFGISNQIIREAAILDFALTGNTDYIEAAVLTDENFNPIVGTVAVDPVVNPVVVLTADIATLIEEDTEAQVATLTVSRGSTDGDLTVHYALTGNGASPTSDQDFVGGSSVAGSVVIADGEGSATFQVEVIDDSIDEGLEAFDVSISLDPAQAENYELLVSSVRLAIQDDDEAPVLNEVLGTDGGDYLTGTSGNDAIFSLGGSYDRSAGGDGADEFVFGQETRNGIRERDVILDYEVGIDSIVLIEGANVGAVRQSSGGAVIFLEGDNDAIYVRGDGVTDDNLAIFTEAEFDFG